jgi:hypothetical protein
VLGVKGLSHADLSRWVQGGRNRRGRGRRKTGVMCPAQGRTYAASCRSDLSRGVRRNGLPC